MAQDHLPDERAAEGDAGASPQPVHRGEPVRVLIADDNPAIHSDFRKIFSSTVGDELDALAGEIFGVATPAPSTRVIELDTALQGAAALTLVERSLAEGRPYSVAFIDVRMPPGWDGVMTLEKIWEVDPRVEVVLCSAYSDYSWKQLMARVGGTDQLLFLRKPFEVPEVRQLVHALAGKWALARANEDRLHQLEARVSERTSELAEANQRLRRESLERLRTERELRQAQRLDALGRLAADIGYEINNPLTFMNAGIDTLSGELDGLADHLDEGLHLELRELLDAAAIGVDRIAQIVRSIEMFGKPDERPAELVDMRSVTRLALRMVEKEIPPDVEVVADLDDVPPVLGKRVALEQVLVNLIQNAAHATASAQRGDDDQPRRIELRCTSDRHGSVLTEVRDQGVGIPAVHIDKIFDPFFTTKPVNQGSGLGLSICHSIVRDLGGEISVDSTEGVGTTVSVRLPVIRLGSPEMSALLPEREPAPALCSTDLRGRILVVDDEPLIVSTLEQALRTHEVVGAESGRDALARCEDESFDLILCDLMMPEMSGMVFYDRLSAAHPGMEKRVVFMTGGSLLPDVQHFLIGVPNECLEKPLSMRHLQPFVNERVRSVRDRGVS
ncbi:response regulator [Haliangium sp.]|uniref:response regulator n=1 Tax=Haliangium sp. TaxID=2663208 RepID=UPI003D0E2781